MQRTDVHKPTRQHTRAMRFQPFTYTQATNQHSHSTVFVQPSMKRFSLCYRTIVLSVLSIMLVYCGQTVGWIRMTLGTEVDLGPSLHCIRWGPSSPQRKEHSSPPHSQFTDAGSPASVNRGACLLWQNGWMDQDATWYRGRPR